jgi:hypothetical protein
MFRTRRGRWLVFGACLVTAACVVVSSGTRRLTLDPGTPQFVKTPVRAHLANGDVVVFADGAAITTTEIVGTGFRYDATRKPTGSVSTLPIAGVVGLESYMRKVNEGRTLLYSAVTLSASALGTIIAGLVIFGSCPTIYADSAGTPALQAESFSYSIAPLLARRDVDRLSVTADSNGVVRLDVRNEAAETHYIDQMELIEARHEANEVASPVARGGIVALKNLAPLADVRDARNRNVARQLAGVDGSVFASEPSLLRNAAAGTEPAEDHLEFAVPRRRGQRDSLAILLTMRSSLMSTVVFYEHMLARSGARSLDWIGEDLSRITTVAQVARWYTGNFGLRVEVRDGNEWRQVVRLVDFGPVAWRTVAAIIPPVQGGGDSVHVRLRMAPDEFHVERLAVTNDVRMIEPRKLTVARVTTGAGRDVKDARDFLAKADDRHFVTEPGHRFFAEYDAGRHSGARTFMMAADGYYVEWLRPAWIAAAREEGRGFLPFSTQTTKQDILRSWLASKDSLEARFYTSRVPVQ